MNRDQMGAAWVLIGGSVLIGAWYWKLLPEEKLARLGRSAAPGTGTAPAPVEQVVPLKPGTHGDWVPQWGDSENARKAREQLEKAGQAPTDAGKIIAGLVGFFLGKEA
jgi:hypothetical protein